MAGNAANTRVIAHDNARLAAALRRVRRRLDSVLRTTHRAAARERARGRDGGAVDELERIVVELRRAIAETHRDADADDGARETRVDGGAAREEPGRMSPPLGEVIDELRRR